MRLNLEYARYIQWLYLDAKLHKTFEEQEKEAMVRIHVDSIAQTVRRARI